MLVGFGGTTAQVICDAIQKHHFGNIILFKRNIQNAEQLRTLCQKIWDACLQHNGIAPLIAIDQEGGSVRRIFEGVTDVPGQMAIASASIENKKASKQVAHIVARQLKELGIGLNLAPVVDVNTNPYNPVIGVRSYGDDPKRVSRLAQEFVKEHQKQGVAACYKHFCGHGSVQVDSHIGVPVVDKSLSQLSECELVPYMDMQKSGSAPAAVMTAHILYPQIDKDNIATLSQAILGGILRDKLQYNGLVLTDCFEMEGLSKTLRIEDAAVQSLQSGADIITVSHTLDRQIAVHNALCEAIESQKIKKSVLDAIQTRIGDTKAKFLGKQMGTKRLKPADFDKSERMANRLSRGSICVQGEMGDLTEAVVIGVKNFASTIAEDRVDCIDVAQKVGEALGLDFVSVSMEEMCAVYGSAHKTSEIKTSKTEQGLQSLLQEMDTWVKDRRVILCLSNAQIDKQQQALYDFFVQKKDTVLVSLRTPYDMLHRQKPSCHVAIFEYTHLAIRSLIEVLQSKKASGTMPVVLS